MLSVLSGMHCERPDSKEGRISLRGLNFGSCFMSQDEGMSESPVETLEEAVGLRLIWTRGNHIILTPQEAHGIQCLKR